MKSNLAGFSYIYNAVKFDIPFVESIKSVIDVVDEFILTECCSQDETWDLCLKLQSEYPDKIKLFRHPWVTHFTQISSLANWTLEYVRQDIKYVMQLQSDEVVHEKDLDKLVAIPLLLDASKKHAARWNYFHFLASPEVVFPFVYQDAIRIVARNSGWRVISDGVQFALNQRFLPPSDILNTDIEVFHYGKMKEPKRAWEKEWDFQNLFKDLNFPDPRMMQMKEALGENFCDYPFLFEDAIKRGVVSRFAGTHPKVMEERIKQFKDMGWEQFQSKIIEGLKLL